MDTVEVVEILGVASIFRPGDDSCCRISKKENF
jgi:hypothetical protein